MITSFIDGRIRIRDEKLKSIAVVSHMEKRLSQLKGILNVSINQRTGSILIFYDRTVLRIEQALHVLADYLDIVRVVCKSRISSIADRKIVNPVRRLCLLNGVNLGMLASLAVSMFGAALDIAVLHITAGIVFLGFLGLHIFRYKNMFFA
jgi:hypothetical protein